MQQNINVLFFNTTLNFTTQCSLGIEFLNPNVAGDMAQLLISNQKKYVPIYSLDGIDSIVLENIPFHGDQLFEERARNTQYTYQDGDTPYDRLEGVETEFADWHAKYNLYMVCNLRQKQFYKNKACITVSLKG